MNHCQREGAVRQALRGNMGAATTPMHKHGGACNGWICGPAAPGGAWRRGAELLQEAPLFRLHANPFVSWNQRPRHLPGRRVAQSTRARSANPPPCRGYTWYGNPPPIPRRKSSRTSFAVSWLLTPDSWYGIPLRRTAQAGSSIFVFQQPSDGPSLCKPYVDDDTLRSRPPRSADPTSASAPSRSPLRLAFVRP